MKVNYTEQELRRLFDNITAPFESKKDYRPYLVTKIKERRKQLGYLEEKDNHARRHRIQLDKLAKIIGHLTWGPL